MEDNPFNINNDYSSFRDNHNAALNEFLSIENHKSQEEGLRIIIDIAYYLRYISNENDLKIVIDELKKSNSLFNLDSIERKFIETVKTNNYNTLQKTRLKAVVYSELLKHNAYKLAYTNLYPEGFGEFEFLVYKDVVTTTIKSFEQNIKKAEVNSKQQIEDEPEYPFIKVGAKEKFLEYRAKHILDLHLDYSALFHMMKDKSFIDKINQKAFVQWLYQNKYINEKQNQEILKSNQLATLKNSRSDQRLNNFNNIFILSK